MSDSNSQIADKKAQIGSEMIIPVVAFFFTIYYFWSIAESPWTAKVNAYIMGSILITVITIYFVSRIKMLRAGQATMGMGSLFEPRAMLKKRALFVVFTLAYLIGMEWIGFTPATFLFL